MAVTLGLMFRIDGFPPAAPVPPLQQGMQPVPPIIEAHKVVEPTLMASSNGARNNMMARSGYFGPDNQQPLTYSRKGGASAELLSGRLLDTYV
ncbi:hypothetical protein MMIC_P0510 [Mariprofundus micogutta]|uniref:Uncharacterized protein n=1 Tax=Mariprofundus micogutta TaxID=1921010 RepID=A0A1L8CKY2_9PROT|nr:hypothetical protein [Mariprofundus micogutta]GAV19563.1 hypothetical protein MMIC_P0510 [Mariprofundus micogutta]